MEEKEDREEKSGLGPFRETLTLLSLSLSWISGPYINMS